MPELTVQPPVDAHESWRAWLLTGVRLPPLDRRRVRGAHKGLKKMLVEGMKWGGEEPYSWKEFSDAMLRQSVGEGMRSLRREETRLIELAYFGGLSNREIAGRMDLTETAVRRRLRTAMAKLGDHVERGRWLGRRAVCAVGACLSARWAADSAHQLAPVGALVAAAALLYVQPAAVVDRVDPGPPHPVTMALPASQAPLDPAPTRALRPSSVTAPPASSSAPTSPPTVITALSLPQISLPSLHPPSWSVPVSAPALPPPPLKLEPPV